MNIELARRKLIERMESIPMKNAIKQFPDAEVKKLLKHYPDLDETLMTQEECVAPRTVEEPWDSYIRIFTYNGDQPNNGNRPNMNISEERQNLIERMKTPRLKGFIEHATEAKIEQIVLREQEYEEWKRGWKAKPSHWDYENFDDLLAEATGYEEIVWVNRVIRPDDDDEHFWEGFRNWLLSLYLTVRIGEDEERYMEIGYSIFDYSYQMCKCHMREMFDTDRPSYIFRREQ